MAAVIMDSRAIAASLRQQLQQEVTVISRQYNQTPGLVIIGMSNDQGTIDMARIVGRVAPEIGVRATTQLIASNIKGSELRRQIEQLNQDPSIHGISIQLPLPKHLDVDEISSFIVPEKDVEGEHPINQGRLQMGKPLMVAPPALAAMKLLSLYNINPAGRHVVVVGRNLMIGRPLSSLMTKADATITLCHSITRNLATHTRQAEILISAAGVPGLIKLEMVRPGAVVIDYGINYLGKAKIVGDVDFDKVQAVAGAITPMPGGTGPLTVICLFENLLKATRQQMGNESGRGVKPAAEAEMSFNFRNEGSSEQEGRDSLVPNSTPVLRNGYGQ